MTMEVSCSSAHPSSLMTLSSLATSLQCRRTGLARKWDAYRLTLNSDLRSLAALNTLDLVLSLI